MPNASALDELFKTGYDENQEFDFDINDIELKVDELEEKLQSEIEEDISELSYIANEESNIANPDNLGKTVLNVVWDQLMGQISIKAGDDFISENNGMTLDLSADAHIQTAENFAEGKIASHNTEIDYQARYNDWRKNFQTDPKIEYTTEQYRYDSNHQVWEQKDYRTGTWKNVLQKDARADFDKGRPTGNTSANVDMDHTVSAAEIIRDAEANAHLYRAEQVAFANSKENLNLMDSAANRSKGDSTMSEFLDDDRKGVRNADRFNIDEKQLRKKDEEARKKYEEIKEEGKKKSEQSGKESQKREFKNISGKVLRTIVVQLLANLVKRLVGHFISWLKSPNKNIKTLMLHFKAAIKDFFVSLKRDVIDIGTNAILTVVEALTGAIGRTIRRTVTFVKQGWHAVKDIINYLKNPANKEQAPEIISLEIGKIVFTGATGINAILLSEGIEKVLSYYVPALAKEIPFLGSLASLIGIVVGGIVSGILGALALYFVNRLIADRQKGEISQKVVTQGNKILSKQDKLLTMKGEDLERNKHDTGETIRIRHNESGEAIKEMIVNIQENISSISYQNEYDRMNSLLDGFDE